MRNRTLPAAPGAAIVLVGIVVAGLVAACASGGATALSTVGGPVPEAGVPASAAPAAEGGGDGGGALDAAFRDDAKIIRTGSLQLEVPDVAAATRAARDAIQALGGYIGASQLSSDGEQTVATITYRVPADRWEDAMDALRRLGNQIGEQTEAVEVTDQIVDLDARIRNLKASETALVRHASSASRVTDLLEIEARLSDVRGEIERLTAQKANLEDRAAMATLTVTFGVEVLAITQAAERWDPAAEVDRAGASLVEFLQAVTSAGIWFVIVWLPILVVLGIVAALILFVVRRVTRGREAPPLPPAAPATPAEG